MGNGASTSSSAVADGNVELIVECGDDNGKKGMLEVHSETTLHQLRDVIAVEFDANMVPNDVSYYFEIAGSGIYISQQQEKHVTAGDAVRKSSASAPDQQAAAASLRLCFETTNNKRKAEDKEPTASRKLSKTMAEAATVEPKGAASADKGNNAILSERSEKENEENKQEKQQVFNNIVVVSDSQSSGPGLAVGVQQQSNEVALDSVGQQQDFVSQFRRENISDLSSFREFMVKKAKPELFATHELVTAASNGQLEKVIHALVEVDFWTKPYCPEFFKKKSSSFPSFQRERCHQEREATDVPTYSFWGKCVPCATRCLIYIFFSLIAPFSCSRRTTRTLSCTESS